MKQTSLNRQWFSGLVVYIYNHLNHTTNNSPASGLTIILNHLND